MSKEEYETPRNTKYQPKSSVQIQDSQHRENLLSPRFRCAAAMAGWDEEALILATLVVEDTPEREPTQKKRTRLQINKTPPTRSRIKRRAQRQSMGSASASKIYIHEEEQETDKKIEEVVKVKEESKREGEGASNKEQMNSCSALAHKKERTDQPLSIESSSASVICLGDDEKEDEKKVMEAVKVEETKREGEGASNKESALALPSMDQLREELSCAVCLEICFEPSTTPCGHSFCKKCLKLAADKCGKRCPKCRQLISNGRSCTVNTVLWNTIQLLFPQEVEARKAAAPVNTREIKKTESPKKSSNRRGEGSVTQSMSILGSESRVRIRRAPVPSQAEDAALAMRLQREEMMGVFRGTTSYEQDQPSRHLHTARANLRAMATRAMQLRIRGRPL